MLDLIRFFWAVVSDKVFVWGSNKREAFETFNSKVKYIATPTYLGVEDAKIVKCDPHHVLTFASNDIVKCDINWFESCVYFSLIMTNKNELYAYGGNWEGQLGFGDHTPIHPTRICRGKNSIREPS